MINLVLALLTATPATLPAQVAAAKCGDTIQAEGTFPRIGIKARPTCPVTLDLTRATVNWLLIQGASNWTVQGGAFTGSRFMAVQVRDSDHLSFENGVYTAWGTAAISTPNSNHIDIGGNSFSHSNGDATDLVSSQFVRVHHNHYFDMTFHNEGNHTDLVQMWSNVGLPITSDVEIDHNNANCDCQGWDNYGNGDGLLVQNINLHDNVIATSLTAAGSFKLCAGTCTMTNNVATTLPGMPHGWGGAQWVMTPAPGATVKISGNVNGAKP